jgi:hypothetical protein
LQVKAHLPDTQALFSERDKGQSLLSEGIRGSRGTRKRKKNTPNGVAGRRVGAGRDVLARRARGTGSLSGGGSTDGELKSIFVFVQG